MDILGIFKDYIFAVLMALFLAYIAYQQLVTNRQKLKLDLYNKRFEVYTTTLKFYQELIGDGVTSETHKDFIEKKEAAKFLFSEDASIYELLNELHEKSFKVKAFKGHREELESNPEIFSKAAQESLEVVNWSVEAVKSLSGKLEKYLNM
ncbi:hypothetical protein CGJ07_21530 [Vibrio parahaemolyticus]|uniref:hypothetical protein n=1 Tax=Vibrio parahaemolyticus TaxID=670 RepID=UPI00111D7F64|nr:hypothetical protein [Vibrio parahaemolyticus]EGR1171067.1 hypothetical protein [Vibrio parahaemolyticus]EGR3365846.1 hypothetical protein [Vibrio parahaemolyticus]EJG1664983.1 hypothetical protein [Vibrio parahaemolyticus]EJG1684180.1 hypothetical protein [Vibrio parahaemolyticus]EJG1773001.1 hypothetical protein [Vibrio parahaemolyticus]